MSENDVVILIVGVAFLAVYFFPSALAHSRGHRRFGYIFVLNLLAGWTFVGWLVCLVWSLVYSPKPPPGYPISGGG